MEYFVHIGLVCLYSFLFYNCISAENKRKKKIRELQSELLDKENEIVRLRVQIHTLSLNIAVLQQKKSKPKEIPKGTIEAVRYAMIHSHPDNRGNSEKFILFRDCYEKLTK